MAEKERRVFAGYYKRYDGKHIFVVTTAKDYESQEAIISENMWLRVQELRNNKRRNTATGKDCFF